MDEHECENYSLVADLVFEMNLKNNQVILVVALTLSPVRENSDLQHFLVRINFIIQQCWVFVVSW